MNNGLVNTRSKNIMNPPTKKSLNNKELSSRLGENPPTPFQEKSNLR